MYAYLSLRYTAILTMLLATTSIPSTPSTTLVCGQEYTGTSGSSYDISCGQTYKGNVIQPSNSKLRRTEWSLERRAAQASFEDCISSCDETASCIAASYLAGQCTLLSSVTGIDQSGEAQAAMKARQASSVLPSIGSSIASEALSSLTKTMPAPGALKTSLSYQDQIAQHISERLSKNAPTITGEDTKIYITAEATGAPSHAASDLSGTPASVTTIPHAKRAAAICSASNVVRNIAVIKQNKAQPVFFCENWNAG